MSSNRWRHAFAYFAVTITVLLGAAIIFDGIHANRDQARDCAIIAAAAASGPRDPVPLARLARQLGCR